MPSNSRSSEAGKNEILRVPLYKDTLSDMEYFFTVLPLEYLHHDDRINPRSIGANIRGLIEEFLEKETPVARWLGMVVAGNGWLRAGQSI